MLNCLTKFHYIGIMLILLGTIVCTRKLKVNYLLLAKVLIFASILIFLIFINWNESSCKESSFGVMLVYALISFFIFLCVKKIWLWIKNQHPRKE